ncbi:hypothetical protein GWI33_004566 [Rhynchophorus ferrugineus]|uniref:Uncharacterized protein n=1 Tax=Rhynchophorus ferrugineus TaxID=354439 RepID=A0A834IP82_RHYFE|nr:hypothetical protein GWI33_004566 [Rhynchophorus ferrugineus]
MLLNEIAQFTIAIGLEDITAVIELVEFSFSGFIYQWSARKKMDLAIRHKEKGARHFNDRNHAEAAYRFTKAIKILCSIPIAVESKAELVDDVPRTDLRALTSKLYNNLSSCYFRENVYDLVSPLCQKVLEFEPNNVKALYKLGVAYKMDRDFDRALDALSKVIKIEPQNKACEHHLAEVRDELKKANAKMDDIMRKMFVGSINK